MFKKTISAMLLLAALAPAWAAEWMTDLEAAKAKAAAENKAVLVDFTGSDWCGFCIRLRKQVLDTPAFETYAKDKFVLMEVDLPENPKFDPALRARNEKIAAQYGITGFPTIMVITPEGDVVGGFNGYVPSVNAATKPLDAALTNISLLKKAESQQGAEQLATLTQVYKNLPAKMRENASGLMKRIAALDPQDTTGLLREQRVRDQRAALAASLRAANTAQEAIAAIDKALTTAEPENKSGMLQAKFDILLMEAKTVDDVKAAIAVGRESIKANPVATPELMQRFESTFANPEAVLQRIQRSRNYKK